jgi:hypothetical protein
MVERVSILIATDDDQISLHANLRKSGSGNLDIKVDHTCFTTRRPKADLALRQFLA